MSRNRGRDGENSVDFPVSPSLYLRPSHRQRGLGAPLPPIGISCQGSSRESGCGNPGDTSAPRRENCCTTLLFSFTSPVGRLSPVCGCRGAGRGAAGEPGLGDSSAWGVRADMASLLGAGRALAVHVQSPPPQPPHALGTRLELGPRLGCMHSPLTPDTQAAGDQGAGARLTQRVAQGGNVCPSFCRAPLVPRMEVRVLAWARGASLGFSNSQL